MIRNQFECLRQHAKQLHRERLSFFGSIQNKPKYSEIGKNKTIFVVFLCSMNHAVTVLCYLCECYINTVYLQSLEIDDILTEMFRASLSGLMESEGREQILWLSFTLVKLPSLLSHLMSASQQIVTSEDVLAALERLLLYDALLDSAETALNE